MHDIDRTQLESSSFEHGQELGESAEFGEFGETMEGPLETSLGETEEIQLATELLEVTNEQELEQFLGNVFSKVGSAVGSFVRSDTGRALGGILKDAAKKALPVIGRGVGQWISPDRGGDIGADAGNLAGRILGLELEGLSNEDREFEISKQFVRFVAAAARRAAAGPQTMPAPALARWAAAAAARAYAPGLLPRLQGRGSRMWPRGGRWVRRGRTIVLYGG
jgi:hypothetical protein